MLTAASEDSLLPTLPGRLRPNPERCPTTSTFIEVNGNGAVLTALQKPTLHKVITYSMRIQVLAGRENLSTYGFIYHPHVHVDDHGDINGVHIWAEHGQATLRDDGEVSPF
ncbi:hypothetical protein KIL84_007813 [Mauremys mutica]|uniref:Uncharacterized protein n=1 Tax=Mauremys mutica TaxID=74926 RepID=A0A9D3X3T7_9SAUR|nr:hypothetical protein KIL84_007813 [Mauremys mutica]